MNCGRRNRRMNNCGCGPKRIVYPVKHETVHCCTEEIVEHVHPIHTTVCNKHIIKNQHVYPHTMSQEQSVQEMNMPNNTGGMGMGGNMVDPAYMGPGMMGNQGNWGHHCHHHGHHHHGGKCCKKKKWC